MELTGRTSAEQIATIHDGLHPNIIRELATFLGLSQKELAAALRINPRTLRNRVAHGRLNAEESEKSLRVARVLRRATQVLEGEHEAKRWVSSPIESLNNQKPMDLLETDIGTQDVLNVLNAIEWGVYL